MAQTEDENKKDIAYLGGVRMVQLALASCGNFDVKACKPCAYPTLFLYRFFRLAKYPVIPSDATMPDFILLLIS